MKSRDAYRYGVLMEERDCGLRSSEGKRNLEEYRGSLFIDTYIGWRYNLITVDDISEDVIRRL